MNLKDKFDLTGKTVLVVGGRGYLGRNFCTTMDEFGAKVFSADLSSLSNAAKSSNNEFSSERIKQYDIDVTDIDSIKNFFDILFNEISSIDIFVYSVTAKPKDFYAPFTECSLEGWQAVFRAEMDGLFLLTQQIGRVMEKQKQGNIILLSSMYGVVGNDQRIYKGANLSSLYAGKDVDSNKQQIFSHAAYPAVKGGIISLTRYLAAYWEGQGIRVNCLSPGGVEHEGENQSFVKNYCSRVPLGRKATIEEISSALVFLASDASSYVNGHNLVVDGGWTAW